MARLCTEILPTGSQCQQFALRGRPWCHAHAEPHQRERTAHARQLVAKIPAMDFFAVAPPRYDLRGAHKYLPPLHAYAIFEAAVTRLDHLRRKKLGSCGKTEKRNCHRRVSYTTVPME